MIHERIQVGTSSLTRVNNLISTVDGDVYDLTRWKLLPRDILVARLRVGQA